MTKKNKYRTYEEVIEVIRSSENKFRSKSMRHTPISLINWDNLEPGDVIFCRGITLSSPVYKTVFLEMSKCKTYIRTRPYEDSDSDGCWYVRDEWKLLEKIYYSRQLISDKKGD